MKFSYSFARIKVILICYVILLLMLISEANELERGRTLAAAYVIPRLRQGTSVHIL
jgi:hypothetical protein